MPLSLFVHYRTQFVDVMHHGLELCESCTEIENFWVYYYYPLLFVLALGSHFVLIRVVMLVVLRGRLDQSMGSRLV